MKEEPFLLARHAFVNKGSLLSFKDYLEENETMEVNAGLSSKPLPHAAIHCRLCKPEMLKRAKATVLLPTDTGGISV